MNNRIRNIKRTNICSLGNYIVVTLQSLLGAFVLLTTKLIYPIKLPNIAWFISFKTYYVFQYSNTLFFNKVTWTKYYFTYKKIFKFNNLLFKLGFITHNSKKCYVKTSIFIRVFFLLKKYCNF